MKLLKCVFYVGAAFMIVTFILFSFIVSHAMRQASNIDLPREAVNVDVDKEREMEQEVAEEEPDSDTGMFSIKFKEIDKLLAEIELDWGYKLNDTSPWDLAASWVQPRKIHNRREKRLGAVLTAMHRSRIVTADVGYHGTQLKLSLLLEGGQPVIFKPQWYNRSHIITGTPYEGRDRHNAEIAAFHLNRLLGFNRVPLTVGRRINLASEILPVATDRLLKTFFSKDGNMCFYGKCLYCKSEADGVCGEGDVLEGALVLVLPRKLSFVKFRHPWGRTYREGQLARWQTEGGTYCKAVRDSALMYSSGPLLLDIIDAAVMDYLIGNADRHHFEVFSQAKDSMLIMFDNAKSFGNPNVDEESILAPLQQCKMIRRKTYKRLRRLANGVLIRVLAPVLAWDPLAPLLTEPHYRAMERRLERVIRLIEYYSGLSTSALIDDEYS